MGQVVITCPSGLQLEIREMRGRELGLLASNGEDDGSPESKKKKAKNVAFNPTDAVLGNLTTSPGAAVSIVDQGPYGSPFDLKRVLICDRFFALLRVRAETWGADYEFRVRCRDQQCPSYKKPFVWSEDLDGLEVKPLPESSREKIKSGNNTFDLLVGGRKAKFSLLTGLDESRQLPEVPKHKLILAQVASRLTYVEGLDVTKWDNLLDWIGDLPVPELIAVREQLEDVDGGVQTNCIAACPDCGLEFDTAIPFGAQGYLLPDKRIGASKASMRPQRSSQ